MERRILKNNTLTHFCETGNIIEDVRKQTNTLSMVVSLRYDTSAIKLFVVFFLHASIKKNDLYPHLSGVRESQCPPAGASSTSTALRAGKQIRPRFGPRTPFVFFSLCASLFFSILPSLTHWTLPQEHLNDLFRLSLENHSALHALRELSTHRFVPDHGSSLLISRHAFGHMLRVSGRFTARREPSQAERLRLSHQKDVVRDETKQL